MSAAGRFLRRTQRGYMFWCPGCESAHLVTTDGTPAWSFNGDLEAPTFSPSVLVKCGRAVDPAFVPEPGDPPGICHSFVTNGRIQFLEDCTHALAGQTVDLPNFEEASR
jgi:hypothetical protein